MFSKTKRFSAGQKIYIFGLTMTQTYDKNKEFGNFFLEIFNKTGTRMTIPFNSDEKNPKILNKITTGSKK